MLPRSPMSVHWQRGISLVEMLITIALGLLLVAAVATLLASHVVEHRRLLAEVRLMQDLRAAVDVIARDVRRSGYWRDAATAVARSASEPSVSNPYAEIWPRPDHSPASSLGYSYAHNEASKSAAGIVASNEYLGFRLNPRTRTIEIRLGGDAAAPDDGDTWQPLTDPQSIVVTRFVVTRTAHDVDLLAHCAKPACPEADPQCAPIQRVSLIRIEVDAGDPHDASLVRTLSTHVRPRNDAITGECPA